jgi:succinoglycan biosynthesis transport protein ExoP
MPTIYRRDLAHSRRLTANGRFEDILREASESFEYVIVDLPPLGVTSDARVLAAKVDCVLLAIEWGGTSKDLVKDTLAANEVAGIRCMGVVLNRVDMNLLRLYQEQPAGRETSFAHRNESGVEHLFDSVSIPRSSLADLRAGAGIRRAIARVRQTSRMP